MQESVQDAFGILQNSVGTENNREWVQGAIDDISVAHEMISGVDVKTILRRLKNNDAVGNDDISSEVYKFAAHTLIAVSAFFLSGRVQEKKLPRKCYCYLKCKTKCSSDINNDRFVPISISIFKFLELVILA